MVDTTNDNTLNSAKYGFVLEGSEAYDFSGYSVSYAGDVNGDGIDDIIIGAPRVYSPLNTDLTELPSDYVSSSGQSYVVFGSANGFGKSLDLGSLDGTNGFTLIGNNLDAQVGTSVSSAGDVNGDGIDDIIIGAPTKGEYLTRGGNFGESYVVFGSDQGFDATIELGSLDGSNGFVVPGLYEEGRSGISVSSAGDINADGIDDFIIGAFYNSLDQGGANYVVFGTADGFDPSFDLSTLDGTNGFTFENIGEGTFPGNSFSSAGDVNGDGIDDIIIGSSSFSGEGPINAGQSHIVFGSADGFDATFDIDALNGTNGFTLVGIGTGDRSGDSVSSAGDVNGDGIDDLIIGASGADTEFEDAGESYVVFGTTEGFDAEFELGALDGSNGFTLSGFDGFGYSGFSVSSAGDVNGDGIDDIIIGAPSSGTDDEETGASYVVFGSSEGFDANVNLSMLDGSNGLTFYGKGDDDYTGWSVSSAGDINDDGIDDLIIGANRADPSDLPDAGSTYIVYGGETLGDFDAADGEADGSIDLSLLGPPNYVPIAMDDQIEFSGTESFLIDVLANDTDADGDYLSIVDYTAEGGTASIEDGQIRFTPDDDPQTDPSLTYTISDGSDESTATVEFIEMIEEETIEEVDQEEEIIDETSTPIFVEDIVASEDVDEEFYGSDGGDDDFAWEITMFFAALIVGAAAFMG